jgi:folate-binding protein YgfZ
VNPISGTAEPIASPPEAWSSLPGLVIRDDGVIDFGDVQAEASAALNGTVIVPLPGLAVIRVRGADATVFLQGQLGNDLREATPARAQLSSYSTPKGRALAVFTVLGRPDGYWLLLPRELAAPTLKRLKMFVMRSKLTIDDASAEVAALGLAGDGAEALLAAAGLPLPATAWGCAETSDLVVLRRPGVKPRFIVLGSPDVLKTLWQSCAGAARPVGPQAFRLLELLDGLPELHIDTAEQHVPQMLNLDQLGGISFTKGCYPGQEIVARLHYLGTLKRRLYVGSSAILPARATPVFAADAPAQPVGEVLDACLTPEGAAVQVVLTISAAEAGGLHLGSSDGPALSLHR